MMVRILIVDDDKDIQFLYQKMLERLGFDVIGVAKDGQEAVDIFKSIHDKPDVILMDHRMPNKNGIEATKEILDINSHTKIIFTSADNSIKNKAISIGALSFKEKPFGIERLKNNILKSMEKNQEI